MPQSDEIKVVIKAKDEASDTIKNVSGSFSNFGGIAKGAAVAVGAAATVATAAFVSFAKGSLKEFSEAQQQMVIANQALSNSFIDITDVQLSNLQGQLKGGQSEMQFLQETMGKVSDAAIKLGFDDEAASVAFAKLFSITKDVDTAQADLKLAMDLSAYSGRSLEESARAVTMVYAGGTRVLKEFGIDVQEGATAADALALAQDKVSGSSDNLSKTFGKQMEIMGLQFENLKETVGGVLAEALMPLMDVISELVADPRFEEMLKQLALTFAELLKAILPLVIEIIPLLIKLLQFLLPIITTLIGWIVEGITAWKNFGENLKWVGEEIDKLFAKIQPLIDKLIALKNAASNALSSAGGAISSAWGSATGALGFQSGGLVNAPLGAGVMALVHGGERVVPANRASGGYGGGIVVNINGGTYLSEDVALEMGDMIIDRLKLQLRV